MDRRTWDPRRSRDSRRACGLRKAAGPGVVVAAPVLTAARRSATVRAAAAVAVTIAVALAAIAIVGCDSSGNPAAGPLKLGATDNGNTYTLKVGDTVEVALSGNATTGFSWTADLTDEDAILVRQLGEPSYAPEATDATLLGAGGTYTFTFEAVAKGEAELRLAYLRPWESVPPERTFAVTLTIE